MIEVQQLARFVTRTDFAQISPAAVEQLKIRVLDTLGVAVAAGETRPTTLPTTWVLSHWKGLANPAPKELR